MVVPGTEILAKIAEAHNGLGEILPVKIMKGAEINPALGELIFKFWVDPDTSECWVNQDNSSWQRTASDWLRGFITPSWADLLTGFLASSLEEAISFLKTKAAEYSAA